jgi:hypothetical protein
MLASYRSVLRIELAETESWTSGNNSNNVKAFLNKVLSSSKEWEVLPLNAVEQLSGNFDKITVTRIENTSEYMGQDIAKRGKNKKCLVVR